MILISLDGLRWQDLFYGADAALIEDERYVEEDLAGLVEDFWAETQDERRRKLMPFFWNYIARKGQLFGNRSYGCDVTVTNGLNFSYPGYHEILAGFADPQIDSNDKIPNPNTTVLEFVNQQPGFEGKVAAFASWDVFPFIINETRSGIPVNAGYRQASGSDLTLREHMLNELQPAIPKEWATVRFDAFTHHYAFEYLRKYRPRLLYIGYGETDDFAHDGRYDAYLRSARQTDAFIQQIWEWVQEDEQYKDNTTLVITTDHGRGHDPIETWTGHGADVVGSEYIWVAVMGPDTSPYGEIRQTCKHAQNQIASTVARLLGLNYTNRIAVGSPILPALGN